MESYVTSLILIIIAMIGVYALKLYRDTRKKIEGGISDPWRYAMQSAAEIAVYAAEQIAADNSDRLKFAEDYIYAYLAKAGFKFSEADRLIIRGAIEAELLKMKNEISG